MAETTARCSEERRRPPQRSACPPGPTTLPAADHEYLRRSSDRQRRQVRRWRLVTAALAVLALAAGTLSVVAVRRGNQLAEQLAAANADTLGRESQNRAPSDLATSTQLALAAWKADPKSPQARTALGQSYLAMRSAELTMPYVTSATSADMLAGGDTVVRVQPPGVVVVTGLAGPSPQRHELHDVLPGKTALCPAGPQLADVGPDGSIRLRSTDTLDAPRVLTNTHGAPQGSVGKLLYSPDGNPGLAGHHGRRNGSTENLGPALGNRGTAQPRSAAYQRAAIGLPQRGPQRGATALRPDIQRRYPDR